MAETYHILDYQALSPELVAVLASGLREDSRIKQKLAGVEIGPDRILLAGILDSLSILIWMRTKNAEKGINKPESILDKMMGKKRESDIVAFDSVEDLEQYYTTRIGWNK